MLKNRKAKGFTLIELLVVVVIIGILAAIALPNFIGAQKKAKVSSVKANMHTYQICAESYGTDMGGVYGLDTAAISPYLPGGTNTPGGTAGTAPNNPFTAAPTAAAAATDNSVAQIVADRKSTTAKSTTCALGGVGYSGFGSGTAGAVGNDTYAIDGADDAGKMVLGNGGHMILSNQ